MSLAKVIAPQVTSRASGRVQAWLSVASLEDATHGECLTVIAGHASDRSPSPSARDMITQCGRDSPTPITQRPAHRAFSVRPIRFRLADGAPVAHLAIPRDGRSGTTVLG